MNTATKDERDSQSDDDEFHIDDEYISGLLDHAPYGVGLEDAYSALSPIARKADSSRDYLRHVYISPEGFALSTDAHVLGILGLNESIAMELDERIAYPVPESHKTDDIELTPDRVVIDCDHETDYTGEYETGDLDDLPQYDKVLMKPHDLDHDDKRSSLGLNTDLLNRLGSALSPEEHPEPKAEIIFNGDMDPAIVRSKIGYGVIMPLRWGHETFGYTPYSEEG
jgi:hypothetical protein